MLFNSYLFLFAFLPITLLGYYSLNHIKKYTMAQVFLICMSLWFYAYFNISCLFLLLGSILVNFMLYRGIAYFGRTTHGCRGLGGKLVLIAGILGNLGIFGYYKYSNFFVENINAAFGTSFVVQNILLPLGISFFTFQQISFLVDSYKGQVEGCSFVEYVLFVVFFPQLIAGPIVTYDEMLSQFRNPAQKSPDADFLAKGVMLFVLGLAKKVILADTFGPAVDWGYEYISVLDSTNAILISLCYTAQLYFDFSGYCDMAKGIGYMLHITIPSNFNSPYQSAGIIELWKRWHITLGRFFTRYVYIPLGGSRKGRARACLNSFIVFCLSGFWHGANWTYILWGVMHGIGYVIDYLGRPVWKKIPRFLMVFATFCFFDLSVVVFRSADLGEACRMYQAIFTGGFGKPMAEIASFFNRDELWLPLQYLGLTSLPLAEYYGFLLFGGLSVYLLFVGKNAVERVEASRFGILGAVGTAVLFLYSVVCLSGVSSFLYFNF